MQAMSMIESRGWPNGRLFGFLTLTSGLVATFQTILTSVAILAINLVTGILTARYLGPSGRGEQAAMAVWPQLFAFCFSVGMPLTIIYKVKQDPGRASEFVVSALIVSTVAGTVAGLVGVALIPHWLGNYSLDTIRFAQLIMIATPLSAIYYVAAAAVQAAGRFARYNGLLLIPPLLTLIGLLVLVESDAFWPKSSTLAYVLPVVPALVCALAFLFRIYRPVFAIRRRIMKTLLSYGMRVWGIDLLVTLSRQVDRAILVGLLIPSELGAYVVAQSMASMLSVIPNSVYAVLYPRAAGRSSKDILASSGLAIRVCGIIVGLAAVALGLCVPFLLTMLYGPAFAEAVVPFRILAVDAVLAAVNVLSVQAFMAAGRPGVVAILQAIGLVAYIPLAFVLVPLYGLEGAAVAWLGGSALRLVSIFCCFPLVLHVSPPWPILRRSDLLELRTKISLGRRA
jgi:O-antigen/teichoic acid export membrane protein